MKTPHSDRKSKVDKKNEIRRILILRALLDNGPLSLTDLAKMTGMTLPVASNIVALLRKKKQVVQSKEKGATQAGRPPSIVKLNGEAGVILERMVPIPQVAVQCGLILAFCPQRVGLVTDLIWIKLLACHHRRRPRPQSGGPERVTGLAAGGWS